MRKVNQRPNVHNIVKNDLSGMAGAIQHVTTETVITTVEIATVHQDVETTGRAMESVTHCVSMTPATKIVAIVNVLLDVGGNG